MDIKTSPHIPTRFVYISRHLHIEDPKVYGLPPTEGTGTRSAYLLPPSRNRAAISRRRPPSFRRNLATQQWLRTYRHYAARLICSPNVLPSHPLVGRPSRPEYAVGLGTTSVTARILDPCRVLALKAPPRAKSRHWSWPCSQPRCSEEH